ncbi:MAG: DJ-1 family protein [Candidatus Magasanikbacteria bacterium CG10_big_fil_rev_8_21_14_0_10_40_10]|uniref:DJ-1 family protein n=1 Tax=Candidatus Magasanikbacteria bacterium CG10_big_fil_rev_8_21_14_0_10_40_10 TaxID=1974648 RepID=A0A2M6W3W2_9BACT|nr:MAG: DJ-1 family protein [Candidatus Magasanikbacteria bacterium CG10_big_fil_rev_8_21_14_0_10_40_10]
MSKKVLLIIASHGFQPIEYFHTKKALQENGVEVFTASDQKGIAVCALANQSVSVDLDFDQIAPIDYEGVFLIGGPGALEHLDNEIVYNIMRQTADGGKLFGAICISPRILAKAGLLLDKKATGWNGDDELGDILKSAGAVYVREDVVVDGQLITANGPKAAEKFGREIARSL